MDENKEDGVSYSLKALKKIGMHPHETHFSKKCLAIFGTSCNIFALIFTHLYFVFGDLKLQYFVQAVESLMVLYQLTLKVLLLWYYKKDMIFLLEQLKEVMIIDEHVPEEYGKDLHWLLGLPLRIFKMYKIVILLDVVFFSLKPWYANGAMPFDSWIPDGWGWLQVIYMSHVLSMCFDGYIVLGYESLFASLCTNMIVQLRILKYKIRNVDYNDMEQLRIIYKHHNFIIRFVRKLRQMYSMLFLSQIGITTLTYCMEFYLVTSSELSIGYTIKSAFFCFTLTIQFSFYCIPATQVCDEAIELGDAAYDSQWYNFGPRVRIYVLLIIMRSRRTLTFTAGGFHDVNWETIKIVLKTSISYFTILSTMRSEDLEEITG